MSKERNYRVWNQIKGHVAAHLSEIRPGETPADAIERLYLLAIQPTPTERDVPVQTGVSKSHTPVENKGFSDNSSSQATGWEKELRKLLDKAPTPLGIEQFISTLLASKEKELLEGTEEMKVEISSGSIGSGIAIRNSILSQVQKLITTVFNEKGV